MAVGPQSAEIEDSPVRVVRLLERMTFGGDAFDDDINEFNRTMNAGHRMSKWFAQEFGSTQCRAVTRCDFSTPAGVDGFIKSDCMTRCGEIAEKVAERVQRTVGELDGVRPAAALS